LGAFDDVVPKTRRIISLKKKKRKQSQTKKDLHNVFSGISAIHYSILFVKK
jgi:hypothetical protein